MADQDAERPQDQDPDDLPPPSSDAADEAAGPPRPDDQTGGAPPPPGGQSAVPPPPPPPPPPPGGPGAVPPYAPAAGGAQVASPRFSAGEAISYGWGAFKANAGPLILTILVILLTNTLLAWLAPDNVVLAIGWSALQLFVSLVLGLGIIRVALAVLDGRTPYVNDLVSTAGLLPYVIATLLVAVIVTIGLILCVIPGLIAAFLLQFYAFAILDDRSGGEADPIGALRRSFQITSNNVGGLILLALACLGINFIGAMLCGLGLLVSIPVSWVAVAYAWRFFSNGTIAPQNA